MVITFPQVFDSEVLAQQVSSGDLKNLIEGMLTVLTDKRVKELADGAKVTHYVNALMGPLLLKANQTNVLGYVCIVIGHLI